MFIITRTFRTIVAISAVGAVLGVTGVASAATVVRQPGTPTTIVSAPPTVAAKWLNPDKFGSATKGITNADCESLASTVNSLNTAAGYASGAGNNMLAGQLLTNAYNTEQTLDTLCFQID
jgi:hypothetical protein